MPWTRHVRAGRDLVRRAFEAANQIGDLTFAAYSCNHLNTNLLAAGDPLAEVQREAEHGLAFAQKMRFGLVIDIITDQLGLIRTLRGLTPTFGCFDDEQFDELASSTIWRVTRIWRWPSAGTGSASCRRASLPATMRRALEASSRAQRLLWTSPSHVRNGGVSLLRCARPRGILRFRICRARDSSISRLWSPTTSSSKYGRRIARRISRTALRWSARRSPASKAARSMPCTFTNRPSARRSANGFVHNEALANELAARFYAARGFEKIAHAYLRNARDCYLRWGADGKVRQLDATVSAASETEEPAPAPTSTIGAPVEQLDLATVIKVSQAISGEIVLEKLIDTLMRTAIEQAGAERGLLIFSRGAEQRIAAEATTEWRFGDRASARRGRGCDSAAGVGAPLCPAHPGKRYSRRCVISQSIFCRSLHRSAVSSVLFSVCR